MKRPPDTANLHCLRALLFLCALLSVCFSDGTDGIGLQILPPHAASPHLTTRGLQPHQNLAVTSTASPTELEGREYTITPAQTEEDERRKGYRQNAVAYAAQNTYKSPVAGRWWILFDYTATHCSPASTLQCVGRAPPHLHA